MRMLLAAVLISYALFVLWFVDAIGQVGQDISVAHQQSLTTFPEAFVRFDGVKKGFVVWSWRPLEVGQNWSLVSSTNPIDETFTPELAEMTVRYGEWISDKRIASSALEELAKLSKAAEIAGHPIIITSAYRSAEEQAQLLRELAATRGEAYAKKYVASPGQSEHQLGLAVDVSDYTPACEKQFNSCWLTDDTSRWLEQNGPDFGFILRYPRGKTAITGVDYESWHLRFVGPIMAQFVRESGLTFDEIIGKLETARAG